MAGLAIAVGTWASIMIMVNFLFGIIIFREPVHDILGTFSSFVLLIFGLIGMSHYSEPQKMSSLQSQTNRDPENYATMSTPLQDSSVDGLMIEQNMQDAVDGVHVELLGVPLSKRQCGILGAVLNGFFTGGSLIPLHYAKLEGYGGANYIISMASGSFIANCCLWLGVYLYKVYTFRQADHAGQEAMKAMPRLYLKELLVPGTLAGVLLAIAMFGSIIAVTYLGQGVGNSVVQTKILISGLWGIFFYKEISGTKTIVMWFVSAAVSLVAIIWLSLERLYAASKEGDSGGHRLLATAFES